MKIKNLITVGVIALVVILNVNYAIGGYGYTSSNLLKVAHAGIPPSDDSSSDSDSGSGSESDTSWGNNFTSSNECCDTLFDLTNSRFCNISVIKNPASQLCVTGYLWTFYNCDSVEIYRDSTKSNIKPQAPLDVCYVQKSEITNMVTTDIVICAYDGGPCNICEEVRGVCPPLN